MGLFSKIGSVSSNGGGVYFHTGFVGVVECREVKMIKARTGKDMFVSEFTVLESNMLDKHAIGSRVSYLVTLDPAYLETALGNVKGLAAALFGIAEANVDEAGVEAMIAADNPCQGRQVRAIASNIKTKKGSDFTKVVFEAHVTPE